MLVAIGTIAATDSDHFLVVARAPTTTARQPRQRWFAFVRFVCFVVSIPTQPLRRLTMPDFTHYLFVDFENVQDVDLALVRGQPVHVTLLIGAKQTKMPMKLATQLHTFAAQVRPLEVGGSGRNALDLTLALYLGREIERHPTAHFVVISRDKDFDPMIAHLRASNCQVQRCPSFGDASCFTPPTAKKPRLKKAPPPIPAPTPAPVPARAVTDESALERRRQSVIEHLGNPTNRNRPRTRRSLVAWVQTSLHGSKQDVASLLNYLQQKKVLTIDANDRVQYPTA